MKFTIIAALLGAAASVQVQEQEDAAPPEQHLTEDQCKDVLDIEQADDVGDDELVDVVNHGGSSGGKRIKGSYHAHYGKSHSAINRENRYILGT